MEQSLTAGVLMGILCPIVGTYLLVQWMAIAHFLTIPLFTGAFVFGMFGISQDLVQNGDRFNIKVLKKQ